MLNILKFPDFILYRIALFMYDYCTDRLPRTFSDFFEKVNNSRGVLPYSLGRGVPPGSRKSYPLLDQILQIL